MLEGLERTTASGTVSDLERFALSLLWRGRKLYGLDLRGFAAGAAIPVDPVTSTAATTCSTFALRGFRSDCWRSGSAAIGLLLEYAAGVAR